VLSEVPLLGNRVDQFIWDGTSLTFDINLIACAPGRRISMCPAMGIVNANENGNHNGGVIKFGGW
jgi:hypothetical protein